MHLVPIQPMHFLSNIFFWDSINSYIFFTFSIIKIITVITNTEYSSTRVLSTWYSARRSGQVRNDKTATTRNIKNCTTDNTCQWQLAHLDGYRVNEYYWCRGAPAEYILI